jgi:RimJ/RimL family protein N-acetyltransferase
MAIVSLVALRTVEVADYDAIFEQMRDPLSVQMAAFTADDPNDRGAFDSHMGKVLASPGVRFRVVTYDRRFVGTISSFVIEETTEVTYWFERSYWGQGIASRALELFLGEFATRPLHARVASDNIGSLRVLQKAGFQILGTEMSFAPARKSVIEETLMRLD